MKEAADERNFVKRGRTRRGMKKRPKVVPLPTPQNRVIASDEKSQRYIVGIGSQRIAFDLFTRITKLPPGTGDQPAPVLPIRKLWKQKRTSPTK